MSGLGGPPLRGTAQDLGGQVNLTAPNNHTLLHTTSSMVPMTMHPTPQPRTRTSCPPPPHLQVKSQSLTAATPPKTKSPPASPCICPPIPPGASRGKNASSATPSPSSPSPPFPLRHAHTNAAPRTSQRRTMHACARTGQYQRTHTPHPTPSSHHARSSTRFRHALLPSQCKATSQPLPQHTAQTHSTNTNYAF